MTPTLLGLPALSSPPLVGLPIRAIAAAPLPPPELARATSVRPLPTLEIDAACELPPVPLLRRKRPPVFEAVSAVPRRLPGRGWRRS